YGFNAWYQVDAGGEAVFHKLSRDTVAGVGVWNGAENDLDVICATHCRCTIPDSRLYANRSANKVLAVNSQSLNHKGHEGHKGTTC
ncbi:MAG: hypothetical protein WBM52_14190, partial [Thiogranum sp.]